MFKKKWKVHPTWINAANGEIKMAKITKKLKKNRAIRGRGREEKQRSNVHRSNETHLDRRATSRSRRKFDVSPTVLARRRFGLSASSFSSSICKRTEKSISKAIRAGTIRFPLSCGFFSVNASINGRLSSSGIFFRRQMIHLFWFMTIVLSWIGERLSIASSFFVLSDDVSRRATTYRRVCSAENH